VTCDSESGLACPHVRAVERSCKRLARQRESGSAELPCCLSRHAGLVALEQGR